MRGEKAAATADAERATQLVAAARERLAVMAAAERRLAWRAKRLAPTELRVQRYQADAAEHFAELKGLTAGTTS